MTLSASKTQSPERFMRMDVLMVSFHLCTFDQSSDGWKIYGVDGKKKVCLTVFRIVIARVRGSMHQMPIFLYSLTRISS